MSIRETLIRFQSSSAVMSAGRFFVFYSIPILIAFIGFVKKGIDIVIVSIEDFYKLPRRGKISITPHLQCGVHQTNTSQRVGDTRSQKTINRTHLLLFRIYHDASLCVSLGAFSIIFHVFSDCKDTKNWQVMYPH